MLGESSYIFGYYIMQYNLVDCCVQSSIFKETVFINTTQVVFKGFIIANFNDNLNKYINT